MAEKREGSWWQAWHEWLVQQNTKKRIASSVMNPSLPAAPGTYVLQK
ncbi:poly(R)-hydroxyalkanoic acid synthase%2C class I [Legionella pneumophila]|nr:poly(R)-hydroxyalkanoic acid synthase%2C class I [Legionella pneumophila]